MAGTVRDRDAYVVCGRHAVRYRAAIRACPRCWTDDRTGRQGGDTGNATTPVRVVPGGAV